MRHSFARPLLGAVASGGMLALVLGTAAGASGSAKQLVKSAIAATESATALTFAGSIKESGETVTLNVSSDIATDLSRGTIGIGKGTAITRSVGGTIYLDANSAFWTDESGGAAAQLFTDKWVSTAATSQNGQTIAAFVDGSAFLHQVFDTNLQNSAFAFAGSGKVNGKNATVISGHDKKDSTAGRLYVAKSGPPYILRLVLDSTKGTGTITFSRYNKQVHPIAPAGAIDLDTYGQTAG